MNEASLRIVLLAAALSFYVAAGLVFSLLAASGPSLKWVDAVSAIASAYASARIVRSMRMPVDATSDEVRA